MCTGVQFHLTIMFFIVTLCLLMYHVNLKLNVIYLIFQRFSEVNLNVCLLYLRRLL